MYFFETVKFPWEGRSHYRIPSVVVTNNGTVLAFCNDRKDVSHDAAGEVSVTFARKKPGCDWEEVKTIVGYPEWACGIGSAVYDTETGEVMCAFGRKPITTDEWKEYTKEEREEIERQALEKAEKMGIRSGLFYICSKDDGETWYERDNITKQAAVTYTDGNVYDVGGSTHGSSHGIVLKYGDHKGRLVCPSRFSIGSYSTHDEIRFHVYNNCVYSDDHGLTWQASQPVQIGTGEGTLIERGDGTLFFNSRSYYHDGKRRMAISRDCGETWGEFYEDDFLLEDTFQGCNGAFIRIAREDIKDADKYLPEGADSLTVFTNPRAETRFNMTATISFDEGRTWAKTKAIWPSHAAYSSIEWNKHDQRFYMMYERGDKNPYHHGVVIAEFDLEWLMSE